MDEVELLEVAENFKLVAWEVAAALELGALETWAAEEEEAAAEEVA